MMWPARCAMGLVALVAGPVIHTLVWPDGPKPGAKSDPARVVATGPFQAQAASEAPGPAVRVVLESPFGPVAAGPSALRKPERPPETIAAAPRPAPAAAQKAAVADLDQPQDIAGAVAAEKPRSRRAARRAPPPPTMDEPIIEGADAPWIAYEADPPVEERRVRSHRSREASGWSRPVPDRRERSGPVPLPFLSLLGR